MANGVQFLALDANGSPVSGAAVTTAAAGNLGTTDSAGSAALTLAVDQPVTLTVSHPNFVTEKVTFASSVRSGVYDNALFSRTAGTAGVTLTVTLGRCAVAPVAALNEAAIAQLAAGGGNPGAVLLFRPPIDPNTWAYRFQWYNTVPVQRPQQVLLPGSQPSGTAKGWKRFQAITSAPVDVARSGRFFWLIYPQQPASPSPQYVVAVWSPDIPSPVPLPALPMVVFLSPHTRGYQGTYPFGVVSGPARPAGQALPPGQVQPPSPADQPYMTLGAKYLLNEYCFAYQFAERMSPAVLVMPICAHGDWGPFQTGSGMTRLLREVAVFLHRECRTSNLGVQQTGYDPAYRLAGASLRSGGRGIQASDFGAVPPVGHVVVSFFSSGADPAKKLMNPSNWGLPSALPDQYWGAPAPPAGGTDPKAAWAASWTELWDMDGFHPNTGGWYAYLNLLSQWYGASSSRLFRLCHSSGRVPPDPLHDAHPFWQALLKQGYTGPVTVASTPTFGSARELYSQRWSVVAFSDEYILGGDPSVYPPLTGDAHHNTAKVAFAHATTLTRVGVRAPVSTTVGP